MREIYAVFVRFWFWLPLHWELDWGRAWVYGIRPFSLLPFVIAFELGFYNIQKAEGTDTR